jgi:hypothetical protein
VSVGVKVTLSAVEPEGGTVAGAVQAKVPGTEAVPPVSIDEDKAWPVVMALAVGHADTVGVALLTVTVTVLVTVLLSALSLGVKVTLSAVVPTGGTVVGVVHVNVPGTEGVPPVRIDEARV